jgi:HAMP domain-containing protein
MSTNPDDLVTELSRWLARHASTEELRAVVDEVDAGDLSREQAEAIEELREELDRGDDGALEMTVRETLQALALPG